MKKSRIIHDISQVLGLLALLFLASCVSFKNGYMKIPESSISGQQVSIDKDLFLNQKQEAVLQSERLISEMEKQQLNKKALTPNQLISLFENVSQHFQLDSISHAQHAIASTIEEKTFWENQIISSASDYYQLFEHDVTLRRIINQGDQGFGVSKRILRNSQKYLLNHYESETNKEKRAIAKSIHRETRVDKSYNLLHNSIGFGSMAVGVLISNIHLAPQPKKNVPRLMPHLEPYDIILQKSRNRLTDKFIPGYFGHAALYMGDSLFAEALHEGVVLSGPNKFAEGDSYLVIRAKNLTPEQKQRIEKLIKIQMGKKYDYQYDAESMNLITCSELVYVAYDFIPWNTRKLLGRHTFSPDDIPGSTLTSDQLEFVVYFDKKRIIPKPDNNFIEELLDK